MKIKKLYNTEQTVVSDAVRGFVEANPSLRYIEEYHAIAKRDIGKKVLILASGGSGCEPLYSGYVARGMADATCVGNIFAAPSAYWLYKTAAMLDSGCGTVFIFGNFAGDNLNHDMACELLDIEGHGCASVVVTDDMASAPKGKENERGGIAGISYMVRLLGAASELGYPLDELAALGARVNANMRTLWVTLDGGYMPVTGKHMYELSEGSAEYGLGFNGEPGLFTAEMGSCDELTSRAVDILLDDIGRKAEDEYYVLVNSLGNLTFQELYTAYGSVCGHCRDIGARLCGGDAAEVFTAQETKGFSITLLRADEEIKRLFSFGTGMPEFIKRR